MHLVSQNADDTRRIAARFAAKMRALLPGRTDALVIALRGELGSGKTTFVQGFARALGVAATPKSPTFLIAKEYPLSGTQYSLWHLDCYRLQGYRDLATLDLHRLFDDGNAIVLIEWPERIGDGLPRDHIEIHFAHAGGDTRSIISDHL